MSGAVARRTAMPVLLAALSACGYASEPVDCTDIPVTVSPGRTPQFSWTRDCPAYRVGVYGGIGVVWSISGGDVLEDVIGPPLRYGSLPARAVLLVPSLPLQAGGNYTVELTKRNRLGGGESNMARVSFTP